MTDYLETGCGQFAKERDYQIEVKGYSDQWQKQHPQYYNQGQLQYAASEFSKKEHVSRSAPLFWDQEWWSKAIEKPFKDRLRIAGAFLAAYYDYEFN